MNDDLIDLPDFMPYQLAVAAAAVTRCLARLYSDRFGLSVSEWRVMAVVARFPGLSANEVAERGALDKVQVSRAVATLTARDLLDRRAADADRRRSELSLTPQGSALYRQIVPLALAEEQKMLDQMVEPERRALAAALQRLSEIQE